LRCHEEGGGERSDGQLKAFFRLASGASFAGEFDADLVGSERISA
jgi:hypothetical protein